MRGCQKRLTNMEATGMYGILRMRWTIVLVCVTSTFFAVVVGARSARAGDGTGSLRAGCTCPQADCTTNAVARPLGVCGRNGTTGFCLGCGNSASWTTGYRKGCAGTHADDGGCCTGADCGGASCKDACVTHTWVNDAAASCVNRPSAQGCDNFNCDYIEQTS